MKYTFFSNLSDGAGLALISLAFTRSPPKLTRRSLLKSFGTLQWPPAGPSKLNTRKALTRWVQSLTRLRRLKHYKWALILRTAYPLINGQVPRLKNRLHVSFKFR
jgi:hypothetical protein